MSSIDDVLQTLHAGYRPYHGEIDAGVYTRQKCQNASKARWFCKDRTFICLGCGRKCVLEAPRGFQLVLPIEGAFAQITFAELPAVPADQLVKHLHWLRADQAAYCLNVSKRQVYYLAEFGRLEQHPDAPFRVSAQSVQEEMNKQE